VSTQTKVVLSLARARGLLRPRDLAHDRIPRAVLTRLVDAGQLVRVGRGLYALPDRKVSEHAALAEVASKRPEAVICLLTALRFHNLTTQAPFEVWLGIDNKARVPRLDYPPLRIVRFAPAFLSEGVEQHTVDGVQVRITSVARTVADCFKYRNKIGLDVALEALRESWGERKLQMDELWRYATLCRVANVMRPYLEALT
jgi:predicted transcriptional regulator of viral defense system